MQTILGSSGIIGTELAKSLLQYTDKIRLVSRKPKRINPTDQLVVADLMNTQQVLSAVEGSQVVYLTVGLQYKISVWQKQWPIIMQNVIDACKTHKAKLVFFDNVYAYGLVNGWMKEDTRVNPISKKGEVRAQISQMIMSEVEKGNIDAIIARSADFYGPNTPLSFVTVTVFDNFKKGKKAQWFLDANKKHSMTYTPDAGKATALLGNTNSAYNQVWHLPTDKNVLTGKEFIELAAKEFGVKPNYTVLKMWMIQMVGFFIPVVKESIEMLYQNENDYLFDSTKFEKAFNFTPTSYQDGIVETAKSMKR
ncbi:MAG: NAD-dependent epimerase/dehydratase family protein [Ignavibacteriaceae bacterium]|nr:NAD-dependent epimerase/dehydratase family protein [Ignavibacterium sp.]MCC6254253.1 NAD-dependent epimerase/dehydratase family protein [Ignavibacteriaceae bacterium]HRN27760.1 NAD-dependent epimerase/dehydratase family protein [Ignavibacteriaceae bacterium]HRP91974.1 NAD-dependent epimerase/dehydratase family protein [Ignavibacteriaceae bacterium]HRQ55441.1 NAD-dependent epimerase/dehydratase family protein [Ignavibacteriaceae bacterium]